MSPSQAYTRIALSVKPNFFPELWMTTGCRGLWVQREESRLGEESLEDGSEDREYGDRGLASGDTPKISGKTRDNHHLSRLFYSIDQTPTGPRLSAEVLP